MYSSQQQRDIAPSKLNVILLGDSKVGKSSLVYSLVGQSYKKARAFSTKMFVPQSFTVPTALSLDGEYNVRSVVFWDMPCSEEYDKERRMFHVPIDVIILCFSKDAPETFHSIQKRWLAEISEHMKDVCESAPIVLVRTKSDLSTPNCVPIQDILKLAKELNAVSYVDCSSVTLFSVKNLFQEAVIAGACYRASLPKAPPIGTPPKVKVATEIQKSVPVKSIAPLLIVVGDPACGKSSIVREFFGCDFVGNYTATRIPFTLLLTPLMKSARINATLTQEQLRGKENVFVVDMPSDCTVPMIRRLAHAHSNVLILVCVPIFSLKAAEASARKWAKMAREAVPSSRTLLIGTKLDMYDSTYNSSRAAVTATPPISAAGAADDEGAFFLLEDGKKLAEELGMASYSECSALNMFGVPNLRDYCVNMALSGKTLSQSMRGAMSFASSFLNKFTNDKPSTTPPPSSQSPQLQHSSSKGAASEVGANLELQQQVKQSFDVNVVLIGAPGVGKTSFVERYIRKRFKDGYAATVGANCYQKRIDYDAETVINLQLWDFAGETPLVRLPVELESVVFLCVFDVTNPAPTLEFIAKALDELAAIYGDSPNILKELAASKIDLEWHKDAKEVADSFASEHSFKNDWIRMSARTGQQIAATVSMMLKVVMGKKTSNSSTVPSQPVPAFLQTFHSGGSFDEEEVIVTADNPYIVEEYTGEVKEEVFNASSCPYSRILEQNVDVVTYSHLNKF